jgi:hypothetical protein
VYYQIRSRCTLVAIWCLSCLAQIAGADEPAATDSVPYTLSPRVGTEIDCNERTYFHLFPSVRGFDKASTFRKSSGDVAFVITRRDTAGAISDTTITTSAETAGQLATFVEHYEPICSRTRHFDHMPIKEIVALPAVACTTTRPVMVTLTDGTEYAAQILHAADSALILWKTEAVYDWQTVGENAVSLPYHMIHAVLYKQDTRFKRAMTWGGLGCLIGSAGGALLGLSSGDTETDMGLFVLVETAEEKALGYGCLGGGCGGLAGIIAGITARGREGCVVHGELLAYRNSRSSLNKKAMFPAKIPPELMERAQDTNPPSEPGTGINIKPGWFSQG